MAKVEACNNVFDAPPAWEDITAQVAINRVYNFLNQSKTAEKWGVTPRRVNYYCAGGRIPGAVKMAGVWLLPKTAEKPIDGRRRKHDENSNMR